MATTADIYYTTPSEHGGYQFTPLSELIDTVLLEAQSDPDSYLKNKSRALITLHAKTAIKELTYDMANDVLALELEIGDDLQFIYPQDFVDWVRVSKVGKDGKLLPLDVNYSANIAGSYLQDHEYEILFDHLGDTIEADGENVYNKPFKRRIYYGDYYGGKFQKDTSKLSKYGEFTLDKRRGVFSFDSTLAGANIVVEYISDGLQWDEIHDEEIKVHKYFEQPLLNWVYWKLIQHDRNVPEREKYRAERTFYGSRQTAFRRTANIRFQQISKAFRATTKWVKT